MKTVFTYTVFLCFALLSCKHNTSKCPKCPECANFHAASHEIKVVTPTETHTFLSLSDVHINEDMTETYYGNVTGTQLWSRTKAKIEAVVKEEEPKFMVYLGDLPAYIDATRAQNSHVMLENLRNLEIGIPILYLPGNNDSLEGDYHSFTNDEKETVLSEDTDVSNPWPIINSNSTTIRPFNLDFNTEFGYYSVDLVDNGNVLKVIALNTVIFSNNKTHPYVGDDGVSQQEATQKQMTWFETTLQKLKPTDRVMLMMHIPIGKDGYGGDYMWKQSLTFKDQAGVTHKLQNGFIDLLEKYQSNITGVLNGHTHTDGLRRIYKSHQSDKKSDMISFSISTPGIAVNHDNNPAFKLFTYDSKTFDLLDFETFFASPTKMISPKGDFKFMKDSSYTFSEVYQVKHMPTPIYKTLENQSDTEIVSHVNETLGAHSQYDKKVVLHHPEAVNVYKN